jgi:hypothetical protein
MKSNTLRVAGLCLPFLFIPGAFAGDLVFTTFSAGPNVHARTVAITMTLFGGDVCA